MLTFIVNASIVKCEETEVAYSCWPLVVSSVVLGKTPSDVKWKNTQRWFTREFQERKARNER